jgi:hypothetical protein
VSVALTVFVVPAAFLLVYGGGQRAEIAIGGTAAAGPTA